MTIVSWECRSAQITDDKGVELHRGGFPGQIENALQFEKVTFQEGIASKLQSAAEGVQGIDWGISNPQTSNLDKTFFEDQFSGPCDPHVESTHRECGV